MISSPQRRIGPCEAKKTVAQMPAPAATGAWPAPSFLERHFSIQELAKIWHVSDETVRVRFINEPGVLRFQNGKHITMRMPSIIAVIGLSATPRAPEMTSKPPYFKFFAKDWRSSPTVCRMRLSDRGILITLMALAWDSEDPGSMPADLFA